MTENALDVRLHETHAGVVRIAGELRSPEDWSFRYDLDYLETPAAAPLSVMLPLQAEPLAGAVVRNWFSNLLPEGTVRETIERKLRIRARDDFALLAAIGGECAGAVSLGPVAPPAPMEPAAARDLETLLQQQGEDAGEGQWAALGTPRRLSLAGAQDKIPVVLRNGGRLALPAVGEPSTHILKPESRSLRALRDLEALGLALARAVGLNTIESSLVEVAGRRALLVTRYDREAPAGGNVRRLHQEDFCQALGFPGELKYEAQGGPNLAACAELIRGRLRLGPVALQQFLDWIVYSALIGNADAHAKNLSLLYLRDRIVLAPYYDLVPILTLPETMVDREPALRIGAATRIDAIAAEDWTGLAAATGFGARFVRERVMRIGESLLAKLQAVVEHLLATGADARRLHEAAVAIEGNAGQILRFAPRG